MQLARCRSCDFCSYEEVLVVACRPQVLYRLYRSDGALLYVGLTMSPIHRLQTHAAKKAWWHQVSNITLEHFPDGLSVKDAERLAIATEQPLYNVLQPRRREEKAPLPSPDEAGLTPAERLYRARKTRGLTQTGLAARAQIKLSRVAGYERGQAMPAADCAALSRVLGVLLEDGG